MRSSISKSLVYVRPNKLKTLTHASAKLAEEKSTSAEEQLAKALAEKSELEEKLEAVKASAASRASGVDEEPVDSVKPTPDDE